MPGKQALVFLLLPPKAFALAQRKQRTVDGTHQLGQTRTPCRKMIGKIAHFRSPALQHRLGHIIERRQRAHIVPLPALRTQHAVFANMIARVVEYRPNVPVSGGFALADAVQHSKVQLVERLRRLGRTGTRQPPHALTGGFAHQSIRQQAAPDSLPHEGRQRRKHEDCTEQLCEQRNEQRMLHAEHSRAQSAAERTDRKPAAAAVMKQSGNERTQAIAAGEQGSVADVEIHCRAERDTGCRARRRSAEIRRRQHEQQRTRSRGSEHAEQIDTRKR